MASTTPNDLEYNRRTGTLDRRDHHDATTHAAHAVRVASTEGMRVSWGGIWGGVLSAIGIMLLLGTLGMAVGITAVDPESTDGATMGMAAAGWVGVSMLIALFVGGMVSTRIGAIHDGATGFWEGVLVWIVTLLLMAYLATSGITSLASGAMGMVGKAAQFNPQVSGAMQNPSGVADQLKSRLGDAANPDAIAQKAAEVKPAASKAAWGTFAGLVLSLLASLIGAVVGRRKPPLLTR
jgi:hypothetical protein